VLLLGALPVLTACEEPLRSDFPNQPGGNPLVPEHALLPFPSDYYLVADPSTRTGRRVSIPQEALHENVPAEIFAAADGFSMAPALLAWLPGGFLLSSLPDPLQEGATLEDDSAVFLVNGDTGERFPALVELDQNTPEESQQLLIVRAHRKLDPDTGYVVILRDRLRRRDGTPHAAQDAFRALRDDTPTAAPEIESQREAFVKVRQVIQDQGLAPAEVVLAWSFHTRSEEPVVSPLLHMQQVAWDTPVGDYRFESTWVDDASNWIQEGVFEVPSFLDGRGYVQLDAEGLPILQGTAEEPFRLTIPASVDETRPVILYGHGFLGHFDQSSRGAVNQLCRERRYSTVAADLGFNSGDSTRILTILAAELQNIDWVVSLNWQKMANFTALAKLTRERLSQEIQVDGPGGRFLPLDGEQVHYSGISNGGTFGYVVAATSPALTKAVLIVGGGGLTHFLQRAVNWNDFAPLFEVFYEQPVDVQILLSLLQINMDPIDSINYVHRLTANRFPGLQPLRATLHMAVNDSQVRNILTEWVARTAGVKLVQPSVKEIWGLEPLSAPLPDGVTDVDSALYVYDEHVEPSPITNVPPAEDNGTHGTANRLPVMQEHWYQFIEHGRVMMTCDGPCDPL
jgi:pimeloyl-ACP methyl ester carboxylesterase